MKKFLAALLCAILCVICVACGKGNDHKNPDHTDDDPEVYPYEFGDPVSKLNDNFYKDYPEEEKELFYTLWSEDTTVSVKVDISGYELAKINEAFYSGDTLKRDTYRKCNLTITVNGNDYVYEEVGIRMRGNTSRRDFCNNDGTIYAYVHFRFSLTETFDGEEYEQGSWANELYHDWSNDKDARKLRKDRTFATMEKFYYKWNKNYDQTYIREVYTNRMFQAYGILAPHITLTQFQMKQGDTMENLGVGGLYELIDKQFIKRNFDKDNKGGDLYKCGYPADMSSVSGYGIDDGYVYNLKTNDDPEDFNNHKYLIDFLETLQMEKSKEFEEKLESLMDMDYFARFEAVNFLVGNPDCIRNNANNYYIYFTPAGKTYLIPYDYDRCFGINKDWNPLHNSMTDADPYAAQSFNTFINNPLYQKTILRGGINKYYLKYHNALCDVLDGTWFTYENFQPIYNAYRANYSSLARPSDKIIAQCGANIQPDRFAFSEEGTKNFASNEENISMKDYLERKCTNTVARLGR